eukprot:693912-Pelagomonas_calceolata.AAC.1
MSKVVRHTMIRLDGVFGHELSRTTEQFQWSEGMISQGNLHIDGQSRFMIFKPDISPASQEKSHKLRHEKEKCDVSQMKKLRNNLRTHLMQQNVYNGCNGNKGREGKGYIAVPACGEEHLGHEQGKVQPDINDDAGG